jgi:hypothetical protein
MTAANGKSGITAIMKRTLDSGHLRSQDGAPGRKATGDLSTSLLVTHLDGGRSSGGGVDAVPPWRGVSEVIGIILWLGI